MWEMGSNDAMFMHSLVDDGPYSRRVRETFSGEIITADF